MSSPEPGGENPFTDALQAMLRERNGRIDVDVTLVANLATELTTRCTAPELYDLTRPLALCIEAIRRMPGGERAAEQILLNLFVPISQAVVRSARGEKMVRQEREHARVRPTGLKPPATPGATFRR
ncbi:MAG: hypothetical protein AAF658_15745 [Myxococcota bacterium]